VELFCLVYSVISPRLFSKARGYTRRRAEVRTLLLIGDMGERRYGLGIEFGFNEDRTGDG